MVPMTTDADTRCPTCGGKGGWRNAMSEHDDCRITRAWADCPACGGSGLAGEWVVYGGGGPVALLLGSADGRRYWDEYHRYVLDIIKKSVSNTYRGVAE